jgi:type II secretory ATPase GspE/PulE/Tfp pilus assembly ATPase PilB-like protein
MNLTPRAKRVIDLAYEEARSLGNNYIGTEHLLLGLSIEDGGLAGHVLRKLGANAGRLRAAVHEVQLESEAQRAERERLVKRVKSEFQQAVERRTSLSPEVQALIRVLTTTDPGQLANAAASYLKLAEADRQELAPEKPPEERLQKLVALLQGEVAFQFPASGSSEATAADSENRDSELGDDPARIIRLAHTIIQQAIQDSAEVIRVEPRSDCVAVFFRINGVDEEKMKVPTAIRQPLMAGYRQMADMAMDSAGPQQGRIAIFHAGRDFDLDLRSEPAPDGERIVIAIHEKP